MKSIKLIILFFVIVLASCRNDIDETNTTIDTPVPPVIEQFEQEVLEVTASVTGFVVDELDQPIANAAINIPGGTTTTDEYGHFFIRNFRMNARSTVIKVSKEGYFDGNRRFFPQNGKMSRIKIALLEKKFDQSFESVSGGALTFENGGQVVFGPNSIKKADGSTYAGEVWAAIKWMDPTSLSTVDQMPGNLQGVSLQNQEVALATYGMIAVELEDASGNSLNLLDGQTAEIRMPVPAAILSDAPTTIPLWSFYSDYGLWAEESEARLENGFYVGDVSHFSFWNCDYPYELVNFTARLIDNNGNPIEGLLSSLELPNGGYGVDYSSADGTISGKVPANEMLTFKIYDLCREVIYEAPAGPFSNDVDLGDITVLNAAANSTTVTGELVDCDNNPVSNGLLIFKFNDKTIYKYLNSSVFDVSITTCQSSSEVEVIGVDLDALVQSDVVVIPPNVTTDMGALSACDFQFDNYIQLMIEDTTYVLPLLFVGADSISGSAGTIMNAFSGNDHYVSLGFDGVVVGDYSTLNTVYGIYLYLDGITIRDGMFTNFNVTQFDGAWDVVKGNFSGQLENNNQSGSMNVNVSGSFSWSK